MRDKVDLLKQLNETLKCDDKIVYRESSLWWGQETQGYLTNQGGDVIQNITYVAPDVSVTAADKTDAQTRSMSGRALVRQGGMEIAEQLNLLERGKAMSQEALALLAAPNCPTGTMPVVLMPDQMILQFMNPSVTPWRQIGFLVMSVIMRARHLSNQKCLVLINTAHLY